MALSNGGACLIALGDGSFTEHPQSPGERARSPLEPLLRACQRPALGTDSRGRARRPHPGSRLPRRGSAMRCTATTKRGTPCQKRPMAGHEVCQPHSGGQVGRRSKLTDDLEREILDAVRAGSYLAPAARRAGVSEKTIYEWRRLGREPDAPPRLAQFERAEAEAEVSILASIRH